jgi:hypothetical protein
MRAAVVTPRLGAVARKLLPGDPHMKSARVFRQRLVSSTATALPHGTCASTRHRAAELTACGHRKVLVVG